MSYGRSRHKPSPHFCKATIDHPKPEDCTPKTIPVLLQKLSVQIPAEDVLTFPEGEYVTELIQVKQRVHIDECRLILYNGRSISGGIRIQGFVRKTIKYAAVSGCDRDLSINSLTVDIPFHCKAEIDQLCEASKWNYSRKHHHQRDMYGEPFCEIVWSDVTETETDLSYSSRSIDKKPQTSDCTKCHKTNCHCSKRKKPSLFQHKDGPHCCHEKPTRYPGRSTCECERCKPIQNELCTTTLSQKMIIDISLEIIQEQHLNE